MTHYISLHTDFGTLLFIENDGAVVSMDLGSQKNPIQPGARRADTPVLRAAARQIKEYMAGKRRDFDLPLAPAGTPFQMDVWQALLRIPYGKTVSYADIAAAVGRPRAVRAVGNAVGRNPVPIVIPCHRVIASGGGIGGFSCGLAIKRKLMAIEGIACKK